MPEPTTESTEKFWPTFWARMKAVFRWIGTRLLAPGVALLVVVLAIVLVAMGIKDVQIGGLLGRLFGKKDPEQRAIDVANTISPHRVDPNGVLIPQGTPDSKGVTQAVVVPIQTPGLLSDPSTVTYIPPGSDKPVVVQLPDGVKNSDISQVVVMKPAVIAVTVKDGSGVPAQRVDDLLKKYGS